MRASFLKGGWKNPYGARGNGGNEIHVFPKLDLVVVFTGGAYNQQYSVFQQRETLAKYVLPTFLTAGRLEPGRFRRAEIPVWWVKMGVFLAAGAVIAWVIGLAIPLLAKGSRWAARGIRSGRGVRGVVLAGWINLGLCLVVAEEVLRNKSAHDCMLNGGLVCVAARAWRKGYWTLFGRCSVTLLATAAAVVVLGADVLVIKGVHL